MQLFPSLSLSLSLCANFFKMKLRETAAFHLRWTASSRALPCPSLKPLPHPIYFLLWYGECSGGVRGSQTPFWPKEQGSSALRPNFPGRGGGYWYVITFHWELRQEEALGSFSYTTLLFAHSIIVCMSFLCREKDLELWYTVKTSF